MITEPITIPLEGEQHLIFAEFDREEATLIEQSKQIQARRGAAVFAIAAGKGLLSQLQAGCNINVDAVGRVITVTQPAAPLKLEQTGD